MTKLRKTKWFPSTKRRKKWIRFRVPRSNKKWILFPPVPITQVRGDLMFKRSITGPDQLIAVKKKKIERGYIREYRY